MKLFHLSDLHFGRRFGDYSLADDQYHIIGEIFKAADAEKPDAILIAGDVYDKSTPSEDAVKLFDRFLSEAARRGIKCFISSGNHDSAERVAFGTDVMKAAGIYLSPVYNGRLACSQLGDDIRIYLMPYINPTIAHPFFPDIEIETTEDAVRAVLENEVPDPAFINIIVSHQFVSATKDGSDVDFFKDEQKRSVGGIDNVSYELYKDFDYAALGHIHKPQTVGRRTVRYCGSPLKYSFGDTSKEKTLCVVEINGKNDISIRELPLEPLRGMKELRGSFSELCGMEDNDKDYVKVFVSDSGCDVAATLKNKFSFLVDTVYENTGKTNAGSGKAASLGENKSEIDIIAEFFELEAEEPMTDEERELCLEILSETKNALGEETD